MKWGSYDILHKHILEIESIQMLCSNIYTNGYKDINSLCARDRYLSFDRLNNESSRDGSGHFDKNDDNDERAQREEGLTKAMVKQLKEKNIEVVAFDMDQ